MTFLGGHRYPACMNSAPGFITGCSVFCCCRSALLLFRVFSAFSDRIFFWSLNSIFHSVFMPGKGMKMRYEKTVLRVLVPVNGARRAALPFL